MKVELPDANGTNVISLEVVRQSQHARALYKKCTHANVLVDTSLAQLSCKDCGEKLNPVDWIANAIEEWGRIEDLYRRCREAYARYEGKKRVRCEHCHKITAVKPLTNAEIVALRKEGL